LAEHILAPSPVPTSHGIPVQFSKIEVTFRAAFNSDLPNITHHKALVKQ